MAKARKFESSSTPATPKTPVRKLKKAAQPPTPAAPLIDTTLAAQNVAKILATKAKLGSANETAAAEPARESGSFKQLKESLNRPASHAVSMALGASFGQQKTNLPIPGQKQVAHNQTQGVSRVNVPRRTAG